MKDMPASSQDYEPKWRPLHQAVYDGDTQKVATLLSEGANWRKTLLREGEKPKPPRGKQLYTPNMNALEVAVVAYQVESVINILTHVKPNIDDELVLRAFDKAKGFNYFKIQSVLSEKLGMLVKKKFIQALAEDNIGLLVELARSSFKTEFDSVKDEQGNHILHVIAKKGTKEDLITILKLKSSVTRLINLPNRDGNTPLHIAVKVYNRDVILSLAENGALVAKANLQGDTPLHIAVAHTNSTAVEQLCRVGYLQNRELSHHQVRFDILAKNKQNQTAKSLAKSIYIIQTLDEQMCHRSFQTAIELIYQSETLALKKHLSENPEILNMVDAQGDTLLHHAFMAYQQTGKSCLLEVLNAKPNVNIKNKNGLTPLLLAATLGVWSVVIGERRHLLILYLKELGANMREMDSMGYTALHYAAIDDAPRSIELFVNSAGVYVDTVTSLGLAPIHLAASFGKKHAFDALVRNGADINIVAYPNAVQALFQEQVQTTQAITPLWIALNSDAPDIVNTIFDDCVAKKNTEALQDLRSIDGSTLLHLFAFTKDIKRFKQAVNIGVDPFVENDTHYLAFHSACAVGDLDIVKHYIEVLAPSQSYWSRLKTRTFDVNDLPEKGINALTLADSHEKVVQYLKGKGAVKAQPNAERSKSTIGKVLNFYQSQNAFRGQLESTKINQALNIGRVVGSTVLTYSKGPVGMGVAAAHQALLYGMPTIMQQSSALYYYVKPSIHNNAPKLVESSLDATATITSTVVQGAVQVLGWLDFAANPARRVAGVAVGMGAANVASRFTDNRELQGAAYFFGREMGMFAVEAYQNYDRARSEDAQNVELSNAYDLWTSLLGKELGEHFVATMHQFSQMHQGLQESIGWFEHTVLSYAGISLDTVRKAITDLGLQTLDETIASALTSVSLYPQSLYASMQYYSREILQCRETVLTNIEHSITEHLLPDSLHRNVTLQFLLLNQKVLLSQKLLAKKEEQSKQEENIKVLEEECNVLDASAIDEKAQLASKIETAKNLLSIINQEYDALSEKVTESQKAYDEIWQKTPKGALEFKYKEAQQNQFSGQIKIALLKGEIEFLESHNAEKVVLAEINSQLQEAENALIELNNALAETESEWLKLANPVEVAQLPKHKEAMDKHISEEILVFKNTQVEIHLLREKLYFSQDTLAEDWVDLKNSEQTVLSAKNDFDIIDLRIKAIDSPPPFNSRNLVENALAQYPRDCEQVVKLILDAIVATGMISIPDADARIRSSLVNAFSSHHHKADQLNKVVSHHMAMLTQDYRASLVQRRAQLLKINEAALNEYHVISDQYDKQLNVVLQNKITYETANAGESADSYMIEQILNQPNNWDKVHNSEGIKTTLTLLGQSNMTVNAMIDSGGPSSQAHSAANLAKTLIDYKYLFITAPTIDVRLQEIDTLAESLPKQTLDPTHIYELKHNMDVEIAQQLLSNLNAPTPQIRASSISQQLQNGFSYRDGQSFIFQNDDVSFSDMLTATLEAQDEAGAVLAIANVLQNQTKAISVEEVGVYVSPEIVPHVPRSSHGLKRWWDHAKEEVTHYGKKILKTTGGVSTSINASGVAAGFTYGNQFQVIRFTTPKTPPLFTITPKTPSPVVVASKTDVTTSETVIDKTFVPYPARVIKDIPHVVVMPWESESSVSVQPLMFSAQAQAAVQATTVQTRSQTRSLVQPQPQIQGTPVFQWDAVPQPFLPLRFPIPQNAAFTLRDFTKISAYKAIDIEASMLKTVVNGARSAIAFLSDPAKREEMKLNPGDWPLTYAAYMGVCEVEQVNLKLAIFNAVEGFFHETGSYIGGDVYRALHDEETVTMQRIKEIGEFTSAAATYLSDKQNRIYLGGAVVSYVRDEFGRLVRNEPTQTGTALVNWVNETGQRPAEELVTAGMKDLIYLVAGEAFLRGVGYSSAQAYKLLKENPVNMQFFKEYGIKGPIFEPSKLYSGLPFDNLLLFNKSILDKTTSKVLDGELYPKDKLTSLVNYLERRGVAVYGTDRSPYFVAFRNGAPPQIFWPADPTVLQVKHELSHYLDYKNLGFEGYASLTRYERERMVLERLQNNRLWSGLNELEKEFSIEYVERLKSNKSRLTND